MVKFNTAAEAADWINGSRWKGEKHGLQNTRALLSALGSPDKHMGKILHVAGTNGKGSTCAYLDGALRACGYKVGLFTSPYLRCFNERIMFDGKPIPDEDLMDVAARVREKAEELAEQDIRCTTFELLTACACLYYADKRADYSVMEVGMGGMFDSTNVLDTTVTLVAAIGMDHMKVLGNTEEEIAFQKAGIFKPSVPALVMLGKDSVMEVFRARAREVNAPFRICDEGRVLLYEADKTVFQCKLPTGETVTQTIRVPGLHQIKNASLALSALSILGIDMHKACRGVSQTVWAGRLDKRGNVLVDCGHNPQGANTLKSYVDRFFANKRKVVVTGMMQDKQIEACSKIFASFADAVVATAVDWPRALAPELLAEYYQDKEVYAVEGVKNAFEKAKELAGEDGIVIACGSVYIAGAVIDLIEERKA